MPTYGNGNGRNCWKSQHRRHDDVILKQWNGEKEKDKERIKQEPSSFHFRQFSRNFYLFCYFLRHFVAQSRLVPTPCTFVVFAIGIPILPVILCLINLLLCCRDAVAGVAARRLLSWRCRPSHYQSERFRRKTNFPFLLVF